MNIDTLRLAAAREAFPIRRPPHWMCDTHRAAWLKWWDYADHGYNPRHPRDYGNLGPIMDARTSHTARRATWLERGRHDLELCESICRDACPRHTTEGAPQ